MSLEQIAQEVSAQMSNEAKAMEGRAMMAEFLRRCLSKLAEQDGKPSCWMTLEGTAVSDIRGLEMTNRTERYKARDEVLDMALSHGARLTGEPDGSEPIEIVFSIKAWRSFDRGLGHAMSAEEIGSLRQQLKAQVTQVEAMRQDFCAVIEHAIGEGLEAAAFLKCWNEGDWEGCREFGFTPSQHLTDPTSTPQ